MKAIICADLHFGYPGRIDDCLWSAKVIREYAFCNDIDVVLVLGDLFHDRSNLGIDTNMMVYDFLYKTKYTYKQNWVVFPGNHDLFLKNSWEITSLKHLESVIDVIDCVKLLDIAGRRFWVVPFIHYESNYMNVISSIEKQYKDNDVLLTHIGVKGAIFNTCFALKNWNIVSFVDSPFDQVYTGHFHCRQSIDNKVWYPGSPIPFKFDEGMIEHGFFVYDFNTRTHTNVDIIKVGTELYPNSKIPYDFLTLIDEDAEEYDVSNSKIRVILTRDYSSDELMKMRNTLHKNGALSVSWLSKEDEEDKQSSVQLSLSDPTKLFQDFVGSDNIPNLNKDMLLSLNKAIIEHSEEVDDEY